MTEQKPSLPEKAVITAALRELDGELPPLGTDEAPKTLNIVGGYALIVRGVRTDFSQLTDIVHAGAELPKNWVDTINRIGLKYGLGRGWINNDLMLSGTSLADLEVATGVLEFEPFADQFAHFRVNIATVQTLIRMKIIAVDTSITALNLGGDFSRARDLEDLTRFENTQPGEVQKALQNLRDEDRLLDFETTRKATLLATAGTSPEKILATLGVWDAS